MRKTSIFVLPTLLVSFLISCASNAGKTPIGSSSQTTETSSSLLGESSSIEKTSSSLNNGLDNKEMCLVYDNNEIAVLWSDNDSVKALKQLVASPLTIKLTKYGDFEQYGELGTNLPSDDIEQTARCGDIMLYQSNKIVLFYGTNTYQYTKLGHISMTTIEVTDLLSEDDITITIKLR